MFELITRKDCQYCNESKLLLEKNNLAYTETVIGVDVTRDEVVDKYPQLRVLPIVFKDGKLIGGYSDLLDYIFPPLGETE